VVVVPSRGCGNGGWFPPRKNKRKRENKKIKTKIKKNTKLKPQHLKIKIKKNQITKQINNTITKKPEKRRVGARANLIALWANQNDQGIRLT
jgi:hypothetical protein